MITFQQLIESYQRACIGAASCDLIAAGDSIFEEIVDKIITATARPTPETNELIITEEMKAFRQLALDGKQPVLFMGAMVIRGSMATNEIHFRNSKRPEMNQVITI